MSESGSFLLLVASRVADHTTWIYILININGVGAPHALIPGVWQYLSGKFISSQSTHID